MQWPKRFSLRNRCQLVLPQANTISNIVERAQQHLTSRALSYNSQVERKESNLYRRTRNGEWERLGFGLFVTKDIPPNQTICYFFGDLKRPEDCNRQYSIIINENLFLDSSKHCEEGYNILWLTLLLLLLFIIIQRKMLC